MLLYIGCLHFLLTVCKFYSLLVNPELTSTWQYLSKYLNKIILLQNVVMVFLDQTVFTLVRIAINNLVIYQTVPVYGDALRILKEKCATKRHVHILNNGHKYIHIDLTMIILKKLIMFNVFFSKSVLICFICFRRYQIHLPKPLKQSLAVFSEQHLLGQ